jgi:hypothetical protein
MGRAKELAKNPATQLLHPRTSLSPIQPSTLLEDRLQNYTV